MIDVSVIIPCFNARTWIGETLDSVFRQRLAQLEVIVVDDGSTDESALFVERTFPGVRLVRIDNGGASHARNVGTLLASGRFIQYLDADDLLAPGKLDVQLEALTASNADVAYGDWCELRAGSDATFAPARVISRQIEGDPAVALFTDFWCPPAAYLFRRSIVHRVGGWDEQQPVIEDVRFLLECVLAGAQFVYRGGLAALYRVHTADSLSTRDPGAFTRGCLRNALTLEERWGTSESLTPVRQAALLDVYGQVARASFGRDEETFETAYAALQRLRPGYVPARPWPLALASRLVGYRSAESIAVRYRRAKRTLRAAVHSAPR